jgi:excinuclease ABC subunit C
MANARIEERLRRLPARPGCYIFKDKDGNVLYVGKAASLRNRVPSYFRSSRDLAPKIRTMLTQVDDFEYLTVGSEIEALITENQLVKNYKPKYNTLLRDDKTFPYIVITDEPFPRVLRTRRVEKGHGRYFGPYANSGALNETLKLLKKLFPYRSCALNIVPDKLPRKRHVPTPESHGAGLPVLPSPTPANNFLAPPQANGQSAETHPSANDRACLDYYIHRCVGPCIGAVTQEEYARVIEQVVNFLEGKHELVLQELEQQMTAAADELQFERARVLRDQLRVVQRVAAKQHVEVPGGGDQDVVGLARSENNVLVQLLAVRNGRLIGRETFTMENVAEVDDAGVLAAFLQQYYDTAAIIPPEILLPCTVPDRGVLEEWLAQHRGKRVRIETPVRGDKRRLLDLAADNAREAVEQEQVKWLTDSQKTAAALTELQEALTLPTLPVRLECFDISTIQGTSTVASMVVFENGKPRTDAYRRFRIKTVDGTDDFAAMREVLTRRLKRSGLATSPHPPSPSPLEGEGEQATSIEGGEGEPEAAPLPVQGEVPGVRTAGAEGGEDGTEWTRRPDLIIVDGGKGQLGAALEALRELGIEDQPIAALAKQNEELFLPGRSHPVVLPRTSQALFLVQRLRDEAHRFAITYHRNVRGKRAIVSGLDEIHGVGGARKKALLKRFGSVSELRRASAEEIAAVPGIGPKLAASIKSQLGGA